MKTAQKSVNQKDASKPRTNGLALKILAYQFYIDQLSKTNKDECSCKRKHAEQFLYDHKT